MSSNKRICLGLASTDSHFVPPAAQVAVIPATTGIVPAPPGGREEILLTALPLELFKLITKYLKAADIIRLSLTYWYFHQALAANIGGSSLLQRSRDIIKHHSAYHEDVVLGLFLNNHYRFNRKNEKKWLSYLI
jgi:hypothetical protein